MVIADLFDMTERVVFVTGAAAGIGRAIAEGVAEAGATVVCADRDGAGAGDTAEMIVRNGGVAVGVALDVTDQAAIAEAVKAADKEFGKIDVLFNVAGVPHLPALPHELDPIDWERILKVNLSGTFLCSREVLKGMVARRRGKIINISSTLGQRASKNGKAGAMAAARGAIDAITREMAIAYAETGIQVNALAPSHVRTNIAAQLFPGRPYEEVAEIVFGGAESEIPLGRIAETSDLVGAAIFLASSASDYMTGQIMYIDGGKSAR